MTPSAPYEKVAKTEVSRHVAAARRVRKMWIMLSQRRLKPDHIQTHSLGADLGAEGAEKPKVQAPRAQGPSAVARRVL